jgi:transcription antitermination factor NusG
MKYINTPIGVVLFTAIISGLSVVISDIYHNYKFKKQLEKIEVDHKDSERAREIIDSVLLDLEPKIKQISEERDVLINRVNELSKNNNELTNLGIEIIDSTFINYQEVLKITDSLRTKRL